MLIIAWAALMAVAASDVDDPAIPLIEEVRFAPLLKLERVYTGLGPVGPFFPVAAVDARKNGEAVIECRTGRSGELKRCKVIAETPARYDFGAAAVVMAERKRIFAAGDHAPGELVRVRVPFRLGVPAAVQASPPPAERSGSSAGSAGQASAPSDNVPLQAKNLEWERRPTGRDFALFFPSNAMSAGVEGRATLTCRISGERTLEGCAVVDETPHHYSFGKAAITLAKKFKLKSEQREIGAVPGAGVILSLKFNLPR